MIYLFLFCLKVGIYRPLPPAYGPAINWPKKGTIMKKLSSLLASLALVAALGSSAMAHDMWATAENPAPGQALKAVIGYGHNFPALEAIPDEELQFFKVSVQGPSGSLELAPGQPNYVFNTKAPVDKGSYLVVSNVDPIFWTKTPSGWSMKPKSETPGGLECGHYIEGAKGVVIVGDDNAAELVTKPVGLPIEIVPLANPATVKAGSKLTLQVLLQGKPLAGAKVDGRFGDYSKQTSPTALAFSDTTDQKGLVSFVPLSAGEWIITTRSEAPYPEPATCDKVDYGTSLFFLIK
jgi:uncharacterized GH25 family protein